MKTLFYSLLLFTNISLFAQSNNQEKLKSHQNEKGGCSVYYHNDSVKAVFQNNTSKPNIQITWNNNLNVSGNLCNCWVAQFLARQIGSNSYDTLIIGFNDTSYIDTSILTGIAYNYRLSRKIPCAATQFTNYYSDTIISQTVGIKEKAAPISKIYPIPAINFLFLETDQRVVGEPFSVITITGKTVIRGTISTNKMKLNIEELPQGIYFIRINETVKKFVVN